MPVKCAYAFLAFLFFINFFIWGAARPVQAIWGNVPPTPGYNSSVISAVGDAEMAYRMIGLMLQNLGDHGGKTRNLKEYNYKKLRDWFFLGDSLNQKSNYMPSLAAHYFGGTRKVEDIQEMAQFLSVVGQRPHTEKWRWLAWAIAQYRNKLDDPERALELARILKKTDYPDKPDWAYRMEAMIFFNQQEKLEAYLSLRDSIARYHDNIDASEEWLMIDFLCKQFPDLAKQSSLCLSFSSPEETFFMQ